MYEDEETNQANFDNRLAQLRYEKGVSAREMSLSLGQSTGYINKIENGENSPSLKAFFNICDYLNTTPYEFFNYEIESPKRLRELINCAKKLSRQRIEILITIAKEFTK